MKNLKNDFFYTQEQLEQLEQENTCTCVFDDVPSSFDEMCPSCLRDYKIFIQNVKKREVA
jgi:hypothetical protein